MLLFELNRLVRDSINASLSIGDVIVANPNAPRPAGDFATVYTAEMTATGMRDIEYASNGQDLDEKVVRMFEARMSINFFRDNARQNAAIYASSLAMNSIVDLFNQERVGVIRFSGIRDLTQIFNSSHEERAQLDLFLHFELTPPIEGVTGIDTGHVVGDIDDGSQVIDSIDINIP